VIRGRHTSAGARCCALVLATLCILALAAGPAPTTNPANSTSPPNPTTNTAVQVQQAAIEREPLRRANNTQRTSTTGPTTNELQARSGGAPTVDMKRVALSLALVLGVIFIARFAMKKMFPAVSVGRNSQVIRVVSRSVVGPKQQFLLVKLGKRLVLVGDSGSSMSSLAEISDPAEVAELVGQLQSETHQSSVNAFASIFRKEETQFEPEPDATPSHTIRHELLDGSSDQVSREASEAQQPPDRNLVAVASALNGLTDRVRVLTNRVRGS